MRNNILFLASFFLLSFSLFGQESNPNFYDYLKSISTEYELQFAVVNTHIEELDFDQSIALVDRESDLLRLGEILKSSQLSYVLDGDKILIRKEPVKKEKVSRKNSSKQISGYISDGSTNEKLAFVSVYVDGTYHGVMTDDNGHFTVIIPENLYRQKLVFQYLGYSDKSVDIIDCPSVLDLKMDQKAEEISTIFIIEQPPSLKNNDEEASIQLNISNYDAAGATNFFSLIESNTLSQLSSVSRSKKNEGIFIRGSQANSLILMDNIPVYRFDNYYSIFDNYNSLYFDELNLYKNASPTDLSHYSSGIIDLSSDLPADPTLLNLSSNLFFSTLEVNTPNFNSGWRAKLSARKSYANAEKNPFLKKNNSEFEREERATEGFINTDIRPDVSFSDFNGRIGFENSKHTFYISGLFSESQSSSSASSKFPIDMSSASLIQSNFQSDENQNQGAAANYAYHISPTFYIDTKITHANANKLVFTDVTTSKEKMNTMGLQPIRRDINKVNNNFTTSEAKISIHNITQSNKTSFGLMYLDLESKLIITDNENKPFVLDGEENYISAFGEYTHYFNTNLNAKISLNDYLNTKDSKNYLAYNLLLNYKFSNQFSVRGSHSRSPQFYNESNLENPFGQNYGILNVSTETRIPTMKTDKWMLGFQWLNERWKVNSELFRNDTHGLVDLSDNMLGIQINENRVPKYVLDQGSGATIGLDLSAQYNKNNYTSFLEYTLSHSTVTYDRIYRGQEQISKLDQTHQLSWNQFYTHNKYTFYAINTYQTGTPYIDFQRLGKGNDRSLLSNVDDFLVRLPYYYSLDLGVTYDFNVANNKAQLGVSVYNITNRNNVTSIIQTGKITNTGDKNIRLNATNQDLGRQLNVYFNIFLF